MRNIASTSEVEHIRRHVLHTLIAAYGDSCTIDTLRTHVNRACDGLARTVERQELAAATERLARVAVRRDMMQMSSSRALG